MKTCARCQTARSRDQFNRMAASPDGLQGYCKPCMKAYRDARYGPPRRSCTPGVKTYGSAHTKTRRVRGAASQFACVDGCGNQAQQWSYKGSSPAEMTGPCKVASGRYEFVMAFSPNPFDYEPRCVKCHKAHDREQVPA